MDSEQIKKIVTEGEGQEVEFKESFHSAQDISKVLCSFANSDGGVLFLGITGSGEYKGININLDEIQQKLSAANQNISPNPLISIEKHKVNGAHIIATIIQKCSDDIFYTFNGAIYVRIGSTTRRLEGQTHLEFLRNRQILSFDETFETSSKTTDLDESKIKDYLRARGQDAYLKSHTIREFLVSNRLASANGDLRIKNSAISVFGKDPIKFFPQIEIKLVQFQGIEPVEIIDSMLIQTDLLSSIDQTLAFIKSKLSRNIVVKGEGKRKEFFEYPLEVIREAIVNAVAHRDYFNKDSIQVSIFEDRIEITSPGSLPKGLSKELFGTISVKRNPLTYGFLRDLGYVEGLGTGIPRMKNSMRKAKLPDPHFIITEYFIRVILYNGKSAKKVIEIKSDLNERQKKALKYIQKYKSIKSKTYATINKVSPGTAVNDINEMIDFGFLKKIGEYRDAYYVLK